MVLMAVETSTTRETAQETVDFVCARGIASKVHQREAQFEDTESRKLFMCHIVGALLRIVEAKGGRSISDVGHRSGTGRDTYADTWLLIAVESMFRCSAVCSCVESKYD